VDPAKRVAVILAGGAKTALLKRQASLIEQLARTEEPQVERKLARKPEQAMALVAGGVEVYLPLAGLLDLAKEQVRLADEIAKAQALVERSHRVLTTPISSRAPDQRSYRRSATHWRRRRVPSRGWRRAVKN
jgi:valyl-tRNA synthetase